MPALSPAASNSSVPTPTGMLNGTLRRKKFDDRAQTAVSLQLKSHQTRTHTEPELIVPGASLKVLNMVRWNEIRYVLNLVNSEDFVRTYGAPVHIELSPLYIAVGTSNGAVVGFNYLQEVQFMLLLHHTDSLGFRPDCAVTAMAFSADSSFCAAGYMDGKVVVWDLATHAAKPSGHAELFPHEVIGSILLENRFARNFQGHLTGVPVSSVQFVGDLQHHLVLADVSGLVFFHHGFKKFLKNYFVSLKLLGQNDSNQTDHTDKYTIKACLVLPVGTLPQITDHIGLAAVMTSNILAVVSIRSLNNPSSINPVTHFKISKLKHVETSHMPVSGSLAWYPCIQKTEKEVHNAKLAYAWNNVLTVLEVDNAQIPQNIMQVIGDLKDKDKAVPKLPIFRTARWMTADASHHIVDLSWLNSEILTALVKSPQTTETKLHFLYYSNENGNNTLIEVGVDDLDAQQMSWTDLQVSSRDHIQTFQNYHNSLKIFRHTLMILVNSHSLSQKKILTGKVFKWADRLMDFLAQKDFLAALLKAREYYCSENFGLLVLSGLPHTTEKRHKVVRPFLVKIMSESVAPLFSSAESPEETQRLLLLYLNTIAMFTNDNGLLEPELLDILEAVHEHMGQGVFFSMLQEFILSMQIRNLSPMLFKSLVGHYASRGEGDLLTELICILDTATLNIDETLRLCDVHGLRECSVYIWNQLLHDYMTPLVQLIQDMDSPAYDDEQKLLVFSYMLYILTGRQFPSDELLSFEDAEQSRRAVCGLLFSMTPIAWPAGSSTVFLQLGSVFPYLFKFLKFSAFETLTTLNEFFEHPALNTDTPGDLNRQYIVEALIDLMQVNSADFSETDLVHLLIFIARNYPKYYQFIRLLETVLHSTVERLCTIQDVDLHSDCELALQSLLPFYNVESDQFLTEQIKAAKFYDVLFGIYRSEGKFASALDVWLQKQREMTLMNFERNFAVLASMIEATFVSGSGSNQEKAQLIQFIGDHFDELISRNTDDMVVLANSYNRDLHVMVLKCKDHSVAYKYLKVLFLRYGISEIGGSGIDLVVRFIELLCEFAPDQVSSRLGDFARVIVKYKNRKSSLEDFLSREKCIGALSVLLKEDGRHLEALESLVRAIEEEVENQTGIYNVGELITAGLAVCEDSKEDLWKFYVERLVQLTSKCDGPHLADLNKGIYQCFRKVSVQHQSSKDAFTSIFNDILELATVSNVRAILQEILTSYYFEEQMHAITVQKLNQGIRKYMQKIHMDTLQGWLVRTQNCTSCGKPICGKNVLSINMVAWEHKERNKAFKIEEKVDDYKEADLVLFKCGHNYHLACLYNLGSVGQCVICQQ